MFTTKNVIRNSNIRTILEATIGTTSMTRTKFRPTSSNLNDIREGRNGRKKIPSDIPHVYRSSLHHDEHNKELVTVLIFRNPPPNTFYPLHGMCNERNHLQLLFCNPQMCIFFLHHVQHKIVYHEQLYDIQEMYNVFHHHAQYNILYFLNHISIIKQNQKAEHTLRALGASRSETLSWIPFS